MAESVSGWGTGIPGHGDGGCVCGWGMVTVAEWVGHGG